MEKETTKLFDPNERVDFSETGSNETLNKLKLLVLRVNDSVRIVFRGKPRNVVFKRIEGNMAHFNEGVMPLSSIQLV